jgi:hypothetical protein
MNLEGATMLKRLAFATALLSLGAVSAQALPAAPVQPEIAGDVTLVAGGCGPGYYRNEWGHCRPMGRSGVVVAPGIAVVPPVVVAPVVRGCPPRMWRNRYGRCVY